MRQLRDLELRHLVALDAVATEGTFGRAAHPPRLHPVGRQPADRRPRTARRRLAVRPPRRAPPGRADPARQGRARPRPRHHRPGRRHRRGRRAVPRRRRSAASTSARSRACPTCCCRRSSAGCAASTPTSTSACFEHEDNDAGADAVLAGELDLTFTIGHRDRRPGVGAAARGPVRARRPGRRAAGRAVPDGRPQRHLRSSATRRAAASWTIEDGLRACGADPTFVFRTNDNGAQLAMVRAGMGWAVMPLLAVDTRDPAIDIRTLAPAVPPRQICIAWRRDRTLSPVAARMVDIAGDVAARPPPAARRRLTCGSSSTGRAPSAASSAGACSSTATTSCSWPAAPTARPSPRAG